MTKKPKNDDLYFITRVNKAWLVRIWDGKIKKCHSAYFYDKNYGPISPETSLSEAKYWRDSTIEKLNIKTPRDRNGGYYSSKSSISGYVGVVLEVVKGKPIAWVAHLGYNKRRFYLNNYNYEEAFMKALETRHAMMGIHVPENIIIPSLEEIMRRKNKKNQ